MKRSILIILILLVACGLSHLQAAPREYRYGEEFHFKINSAVLPLAVANAAVEIDIAPHWSLNIPVYYSGWDYFKSTIKFRTFTVQPGVRYWPCCSDGDGLFVEGHFTCAYYNLALDGKYRFQDRDGKHPSLGPGIAIGYRIPLGAKKGDWRMELSIGGGYFELDYDRFTNTSSSRKGSLAGSYKKSYFGIDQINISFIYTFRIGGSR